MKKEEKLHVQWTGTNFPEIYGWLIDGSATRDLSLKVLDPGNPVSVIEIKVFGCNLRLNIGDYIVKDSDNFYYVSTLDEVSDL
jgi:hypothetical protein